ncbi:FHA domain-containing protein [Pseudomonas marincola]|uniref:FHA domain-containing protein n=1 Tax=Pseudomonas marincola TaxID=437900 RepID=A0A653DYJ7_9PSED|nr:type VI secretion system-associated FHA domain protein TagH [Pseudomonas marincola]CAE6936680.1 FHA domain-containing protein [Pseudomonas marincola]
MQLVLEIVEAHECAPDQLLHKTFEYAGGLIGRGDDCEWVITDPTRHLSNQHALISYRNDGYYITDISSNGTQLIESGALLPKGVAQRIESGSSYRLGRLIIRASLIERLAPYTREIGQPLPAGSIIPDDVNFDLDPLVALDQQEDAYAPFDELLALKAAATDDHQRADYARVDKEHLVLPELIAPKVFKPLPDEPVVAPLNQAFWQRFSEALGVDMSGMENADREAMAVNSARLFRQSMLNLQQSLYTRRELKNQLRLSHSVVHKAAKNPLKYATDTDEAVGVLLSPPKAGAVTADQAIYQAFRDLQAHQVAMLSASRAALQSALEHFSPQQLTLRFERDGNKPLFAKAGRRWRAYERYHQALQQDDEWTERLLARDFAQAYEEQCQLIATLNKEDQG